MNSHRQRGFKVRFDWGLDGATAIDRSINVAVVVDVLSFTTTLSVAIDRGITVLPYRWRDHEAGSYAESHQAALAVGRSQAVAGTGLSLSPTSIRLHPSPPKRLVLPSPNGSTIAHHFRTAEIDCIGACLRNAAVVAEWLSRRGPEGQVVGFIAAGERWPNGNLRPAVEDAWGAGAIISELAHLGWTDLSPEAEFAQAAYERVRGDETNALKSCASGQELVDMGHPTDVEIAAEINHSTLVPLLKNDQFVGAEID